MYSIFHLNLNFSSIAEKDYEQVIEKCYWPLINLASKGPFKFGIETSADTLLKIESKDPKLIDKIIELNHNKDIELIGSGYNQIIWQLVPRKVAEWSISEGNKVYEEFFSQIPKIFYVNEQCFSPDIVKLILDHGYIATFQERENFETNLRKDFKYPTIKFTTSSGDQIINLWNSSYLFQVFQRTIYGDISLEDYLEIVIDKNLIIENLCVYGSDCEVFGYRPKRFHSESLLLADEWQRIESLYMTLVENNFKFDLPYEVIQNNIPEDEIDEISLSDLAHPVFVKKQNKYNVTRWSLTGRNDQLLNADSFKAFKLNNDINEKQKRTIINTFASDLRTHVEEVKWNNANVVLGELLSTYKKITHKEERLIEDTSNDRYSTVENDLYKVKVDRKKGLTIESLIYKSHGKQIIGLMPYGSFDDVTFLADFFTSNCLIESSEITRFSDLSVNASNKYENKSHQVFKMSMPNGATKSLYFSKNNEVIEFKYDFSMLNRLNGFVRLAYFTFTDQDFIDNLIFTFNGVSGEKRNLKLYNSFDHGKPLSRLISSNSLIPVPDGMFTVHDGNIGLRFQWDQSENFVMPMAMFEKIGNKSLFRIFFSLGETDETWREGANYGSFNLAIDPNIQI